MDTTILSQKIEQANTLDAINKLREEVVEAMKIYPPILKEWQDKYWSLKRCSSCGHILE